MWPHWFASRFARKELFPIYILLRKDGKGISAVLQQPKTADGDFTKTSPGINDWIPVLPQGKRL
jgi:hypothetical protein